MSGAKREVKYGCVVAFCSFLFTTGIGHDPIAGKGVIIVQILAAPGFKLVCYSSIHATLLCWHLFVVKCLRCVGYAAKSLLVVLLFTYSPVKLTALLGWWILLRTGSSY